MDSILEIWNLKHAQKVAKLILFCLLGGMLGFIVMFFGNYMKASSIASDVARSALLLATQDGCINDAVCDNFCNSMHDVYQTNNNVLVANFPKSNTRVINTNVNGVTVADSDIPTSIIRNFSVDGSDTASYGLISVVNDSNQSIINHGIDYEHHVQRGRSITVYATVEANMHLNFIFTSNGTENESLRFSFPVNAQVSGISCKWFKGENL